MIHYLGYLKGILSVVDEFFSVLWLIVAFYKGLRK